MWTLYNYLAALFLAVWAILSCVVQRTGVPHIVVFDDLGLLPNNRFFAPRPVSMDLALLVRFRDGASDATPWRSMVRGRKHPLLCFVWNPQHRVRKALYDSTELLQDGRLSADIVHVSYPYLLLLNVATAQARHEGHEYVQFAITAYPGFESGIHNLVFLSSFHTC